MKLDPLKTGILAIQEGTRATIFFVDDIARIDLQVVAEAPVADPAPVMPAPEVAP